jgi:hypothetical protein
MNSLNASGLKRITGGFPPTLTCYRWMIPRGIVVNVRVPQGNAPGWDCMGHIR